MNIKTEPTDEVDVDDRLGLPCSSSPSTSSPLSCKATTHTDMDRKSPSSGSLDVDNRSRPAQSHYDQDRSVDTTSQSKVKLEVVSPSISVTRSSPSPPVMSDSKNESVSSQRLVTSSDVVNQDCDDVITATGVSCANDAPSVAAARLKTTESSISKLESFVASLSQHTRRERQLPGISVVPDGSVATVQPWPGSVGHLHIATVAGGGCYDRRMPLPTSPTAASLAAGYIGSRVAAGPSAASYRAPVAMVTSTSLPSGCSNGAEVVLGSAGRREEPLDLSTKKGTNDERRFNQVEESIEERRVFHKPSENVSNGLTVGRLERRQKSGGTAASANSLACLERDFGENSALLNRIGSLNQLRHVQHGLAEFVTQQNANARLSQQSHQVDKRQPPSLVQSFQQHQQHYRPSIDSLSLRAQQNGRQLNVTHERSMSNVAPCVERSAGVVLPAPHPSVGVTASDTSMIGQLLSVNVPHARDQTTWSHGLSQLCGDRDRDDRPSRKQHHQKLQPRRVTPSGDIERQSPANQTATNSALKCLECSGRFSSLPELTLHMIQAGHYANIVRADNGSLPSSAYNGWNDGKDVVNKLSTTRWRQEMDGSASPALSLDEESISSISLTESGSGASMSPIKSPALSTSSLSPPRRNEKNDEDKQLVDDLLHGVDPMVARNLLLGQPSLFDGSINNGSSATAAVAAFGMVIKSMKKYIECSLNQSAIDVDWKSNATAKQQRRPHHNPRRHQTHRDEAMLFDGRSKKPDRETPTHRKNSSSSSTSDSLDATEGTRKTYNLSTVPMKRSLIDRVVNVPDKRRAMESERGSPPGELPLVGECRRPSDGDTRHKLADNLTTRTSVVSTTLAQSVSSKRSPLPLIAGAPPEAPSRSSSQEVGAVCSLLEHRPVRSQTTPPTPSVGRAVSVVAATASQLKNIDDISVSSPSLPQQSATSTANSVVNCSGPSDDNEYTTRFGKYCRLARELAGRAN